MDRELDRVVPLDQLDDYEIAEGDPDVRGWDVMSSDGKKIGEVDNLLVDTDAMKVRYLDVDVDEGLLQAPDDRHVLIPIGYARLDEERDQVFVDALASTDITALPEYTHGPLTRGFEADLRQRFDTGYAAGRTDDDFYAHDLYDERRFFGARRGPRDEARVTLSEEQLEMDRRQRAAGAVEVEKQVETRHVREGVPVRREEEVFERRPAQPGMEAGEGIGGEGVRIPVNREERVVEDEPVEADLRRERVDIHREGDVNPRGDR